MDRTAQGGPLLSGAERGGTVRPGLAGGLAGGLAMVAWMMVSALVDGGDPLAPLWPLGDPFAAAPGAATAAHLLLGLALHLAFWAAVGVLFAALVPHEFPPGSGGAICSGAALLLMAALTTIVLPRVNPSLRAAMPAHGGAWVIAHAVCGFTIGVGAQATRRRVALRVGALRARHA